ncbi:hypothetical protein ACI01nite_20260 [Acetobacter cibinongensis]|uniref:Glycosyl transferase n=1 Tax=Acetobacter cibinongensis TaxID=146475 RepID=A0A0D6N0I3_9PROT|nr:glycosyltransferase [Acetobacter cibinongensis]GAN59439.1 glycosyl transferase [Acetobacter cibinongensis]GBQ12387.1 glycosyltransferase [Acetobacter cibinongensis NRIC 0482]GEL59424.1 hypothetical protein ACI01nite_20260 [Acetobacter cibinongensis]
MAAFYTGFVWQDASLTKEQRAVIASEAAQKSFRLGVESWTAGKPEKAWDWLERANRQAPDNPHVMFALVLARQAAGDRDGVLALLHALVQRFDFQEGWFLLATFQDAYGYLQDALKSLSYVLSNFAYSPEVGELADKLCQKAGLSGWYGLATDGELVSGKALQAVRPTLFFDHVKTSVKKKNGGWYCPDGWCLTQHIQVTAQGYSGILGGAFDVGKITRCEGLVRADPSGITGWAWLPYNAEEAPVLRVLCGDRKKELFSFVAEELSQTVITDRPVARYRHVAIPWDILPEGMVHILGPDRRDLAGSPLDARKIAMGGQFIASCLSQKSNEHLIATNLRALPFLPLPYCKEQIVEPDYNNKKFPLTIIIPVFKGYTVTMACLEAVQKTTCRTKIKIIVVNDASPDVILCNSVKKFCEESHWLYIEHTVNQGFPQAVNTGLEAAAGHDVILLNSDTLVPDGWVAELRSIAYSEKNIGTVTPFSNDASILSYPSREQKNPVPTMDSVEVFMQVAQAANKGQAYDIPTGNGFCLYIRQDCLRQTGVFRDDVFAQGYGEENDFCMRAYALGWQHKAAVGAFVAHIGSASFGESRIELIKRNSDILEALHPGYHAMVADWIKQDPLFEARRRMDLVRFRQKTSSRPHKNTSVLLITHPYGGGVERVVQSHAKAYVKKSLRCLILRPTESGCILEESCDPDSFPSLQFRLPEDWALLKRVLKAEAVRKIEVHHLVGYSPLLYTLPQDLDCSYDVHIHDYMWFCQRISLLGSDGDYCGEPDTDGCTKCLSLAGAQGGEAMDVPEFLARSEVFLRQARRVYAPSQDVAARMARHFPSLLCHVRPLENDAKSVPYGGSPRTPVKFVVGRGALSSPTGNKRVRLCVIGGIGMEKGYAVLHQAALDAAMRDLPLEFVIVGHTPHDQLLLDTGRVFITGEYREEDAVQLIASTASDAAFLPSIWPETWCFTVGLAWRAGLAVLAFDHGAPAERIRATGRGILLDLNLRGAALNEVLIKTVLSGKTAMAQ